MTAASGPMIELYLSEGCCSGERYAQANDSRLYNLSRRSWRSKTCEHVLQDQHSVPLLHSIRAGSIFHRVVEVYKGDIGNESSLVCTMKKSSFLSSNFNVFLAGSSLDGPPDYTLKPPVFGLTIKIFQQDRVVAKGKSDMGFCCECSNPDYTITTFGGIDQALVVLLFVIYEDLRPKNNSSGGSSGGSNVAEG